MELNEYLQTQINGLSPYYLNVFNYLVNEYHHRTHLEEFAPTNPERGINYVKEMILDFWGGTEEDLWGCQTVGLEFNLQAEIDNNPELLEV